MTCPHAPPLKFPCLLGRIRDPTTHNLSHSIISRSAYRSSGMAHSLKGIRIGLMRRPIFLPRAHPDFSLDIKGDLLFFTYSAFIFHIMQKKPATMTIKSVDKAISILNCFSVDKPVLGVGEVSELVALSKSTVSRLLAILESRGCVERPEATADISRDIESICGEQSVKNIITWLPLPRRSWKDCEMSARKRFHYM